MTTKVNSSKAVKTVKTSPAKIKRPAAAKADKPASKHRAVKAADLTKEAVKPAAKLTGNFLSTVGRRKQAVARVWLQFKGEGKITVNGQELAKYFSDPVYQQIIIAPVKQLGMTDKFDLKVKVVGGGKQGQAEAVRHALARALLKSNEDWRKQLRVAGFLTRDARVKERKKYGLKKARRAPQWQKR